MVLRGEGVGGTGRVARKGVRVAQEGRVVEDGDGGEMATPVAATAGMAGSHNFCLREGEGGAKVGRFSGR